MERVMSLAAGSIQRTILSSVLAERFCELERGELTREDFDPIFTHFYNEQVERRERRKYACAQQRAPFRMVAPIAR